MTGAGILEKARTHLQAGRFDEAMAAAQQALAIDPQSVDTMLLMARILRGSGRHELAAQMYETILNQLPGSAEGQAGLGAWYGAMRRYSQAVPPLRRAVELNPDYFEAWSFLGEALIEQGRTEEAMDCFERSHAIRPFNHVVLSKYLFHMTFDPRFDEKSIHAQNFEWGRQVEAAVEPMPVAVRRARRDRLKIGYLSDEFRQGVTARFMAPVLAHHDRNSFEIVCYTRGVEKDDMTAQMAANTDSWRDLATLNDAEAAAEIRQDGVDVLVLCTSYRAESRVIMAYRPAPVQVCYANRVSTTGLESIDYLVTETPADPPGSEAYYSENLVRLSRANVYMPPKTIAGPGPSPSAESGRITFASFNHIGKLTDAVISVWSRVLAAVPRSRLVLKSVNRFSDPDTLHWFEDRFAAQGIGGDRLEFLNGDPDLESHLNRYRDVDIALDPFPCNGGTTSCEALWMGVPVITKAGDTFMGRQGATFLGRLGLDDLIAETPGAYVAAAQRLAEDGARLAKLRERLRGDVEVRLFDPVSHVRELECAYREMWRRCDAGAKAVPFNVAGETVIAAAG